MADPHGRYEQLAVGHVLGGLGSTEAADFRSHLLSCSVCRTRVAELRDIAADLEAAEQDERQRSAIQTVQPRRERMQTDVTSDRRTFGTVTIRHVTVAAVLVLALAGAMAFWNLHLRATASTSAAVADRHADTLRELASGVVIGSTTGEDLEGVVVLDDEQVAFSLSGVDDVELGESIVAWLIDDDGEATVDSTLLARPGQLDDGLLTGVFTLGDATELVIARESGELGSNPQGERLLEADLADPAV